LARRFFERPSARRELFEQFVQRSPELDAYAAFRAADRRHGRPWPRWPDRLAAGRLSPGDYDADLYQYHRYVQWLLDEQLTDLSQQARSRRLAWYLDLPLGVHPDGFDVWRNRDAFALQASGGAPPDSFFTRGQSWGLPPLHPTRLREQGYRYLIDVLRAHLRYAEVLRIDHVMGLHRLFWVPHDMTPGEGVYVRYPAEELYAILTIESQRHRAEIIGENLGTVPPEVNETMDRRDLGRMFVMQFNCHPERHPSVSEAPRNAVASLNTHDTPLFAAFWQGLDIDDRADLGLLEPDQAAAEQQHRARTRDALLATLREQGLLGHDEEDLQAVVEACLALLSRGPAEMVLVSLEDLWLETVPQNTPGTTNERLNWRRKTRRTLEDIRNDPRLQAALQRIDSLRRQS
jgi:4-alpha-glucanotransferase